MYLNYWKLTKMPFENTPDPEFYFFSPEHKEGYERLQYGIANNKGGLLLTGEYGCGKTTTLRLLAGGLDYSKTELVVLNNPMLSPIELLSEILYQLGEEAKNLDRTALIRKCEEVFFRKFQDDMNILIMVDEAQLLRDEDSFEELRLLLNYQLNDRFLVTLILAGQPELREKVMTFPQFEQRLAIKYHFHTFNLENTYNYIRHRLAVAGNKNRIFVNEAISSIFEASYGVPRRINGICDLSLMRGAKISAPSISPEIVASVI